MMILPTNSRRGCLRVLLVLLLSRLTTAQFPSPAPATFPPVSLDTQTPTATATAAPVVVVTTAAPVVAATAAPTDIPTVAPVVVATLEPTLAPIVVTAAPVVAATSVPTAAPVLITLAPVTAAPVTEAPVVTTQAPAVAATSVPTVAPVAATTQVPTVTSTTTAPVITTEAPSTAAPTPVGTETLAPSTAAPVVAVDTNAPTAGSAAPSIGIVPTDAPSVVPTKAPVVLTTSVPSIAPVETFVPTAVGTTGMPATMEPTAQDDTGTGMPSLSPEQDFLQQSETFDEIEMILEGVTEMDATSVGIFEAVTKEWFQEFYNGDNRRRKLAFGDGLASVRIMTTTITFLGQDPVAADPDANQPLPVNTVRYKQEVNYFANAQAPTADQLVLIPFEDSDGNARYVSDLRSFGDATFENVQSPIEVPVIEEIDSGSDGLSGGAIAGIAVGGAVALLAAGYVGFRAMGGSDRSASGYVDPDTRPPASFNVSASEDVSTMEDPNQKVASGDGSLAEYGDQSVATVDYDYSKAYGGGGDTSVVSSAGGTFGDNTRQSAGGIAAGTVAARTALGASFDSENQFAANVKEEVLVIDAPPGKLGVVIDTPDDGAPVVHAVKDSSVIADQIRVADKLVAVDNEDVRSMTAIKVSKLISRKSANPSRKLTVVRTSVVEGP